MTRARIDGSVRLTRCRFDGAVRLDGTQIAGVLFLDEANVAVGDSVRPALQLNQASGDDDLCAGGPRARGRIRRTVPP